MTPYGDRQQKNEYSLGSVTTAEVADPPAVDDDEPADDEEEEEADDPEGKYVCPDCGRGFATEHGLKIHTGKAHPDEGAP
jgi:hypothetical protein